jgi:outer membrane protein assembly factor BamB
MVGSGLLWDCPEWGLGTRAAWLPPTPPNRANKPAIVEPRSPTPLKVVPLACPRCGAPLTIGRKDTQTTCTYCGISCRVARERPPEDPRARKADTVYAPTAYLLPLYLGLGILGLILGAAAAATYGHMTSNARAVRTAASSRSAPQRLLFSDQPMLADTNGDGHPDVVGRCHLLGDVDQMVVAAFDGKTGARLWTTRPLTEEQRSSGGWRYLLGDKLLLLDDLGIVQAFELASGKSAWDGHLPDRPRTVCGHRGQLVVKAEDTSVWGFALDSGRREALTSATECSRIVSNDTPTLDYRMVKASQLGELGLTVSIEGMSVAHALVPTQGNVVFAYGPRIPGTAVATVAAVADNKVLWKTVVPAVAPLRTSYDSPEGNVTYAAGQLVAAYSMRNADEGTRMAAFDATTGRRLWDIEVHQRGRGALGISSCADTVYYAIDGNVHAIDLRDGGQRFQIGIPR